MECHPGALSTLSQSNGIGFYPNNHVSELIRHVTRAIEASVANSSPLVAETEDKATRGNTADLYRTLRGSGARAARSKIKRPRFEG